MKDSYEHIPPIKFISDEDKELYGDMAENYSLIIHLKNHKIFDSYVITFADGKNLQDKNTRDDLIVYISVLHNNLVDFKNSNYMRFNFDKNFIYIYPDEVSMFEFVRTDSLDKVAGKYRSLSDF